MSFNTDLWYVDFRVLPNLAIKFRIALIFMQIGESLSCLGYHNYRHNYHILMS